MKVTGSKYRCGRCQAQYRCKALTLSTTDNTSVVWLCLSCIKIARNTWLQFLKEGPTPEKKTSDAV